jgi:hypothetical protein
MRCEKGEEGLQEVKRSSLSAQMHLKNIVSQVRCENWEEEDDPLELVVSSMIFFG